MEAAKATQPTRFEFYFRSQDVLYSYGFAFDATRIHEEWLFATAKKNEARYFERTTDEKGEVTVAFGPSLRGAIADEARARDLKGASTRADNLAADTRANQLFLSACAERNVGAVAPIMHWFEEILEIISAESPFEPLVLFAHVDRDFATFVGDFLRDAGTGIERVETEGQNLDFDRHFPGLSAEERTELETHFAQIEPESGAIWRERQRKETGCFAQQRGATSVGFVLDFTSRRGRRNGAFSARRRIRWHAKALRSGAHIFCAAQIPQGLDYRRNSTAVCIPT